VSCPRRDGCLESKGKQTNDGYPRQVYRLPSDVLGQSVPCPERSRDRGDLQHPVTGHEPEAGNRAREADQRNAQDSHRLSRRPVVPRRRGKYFPLRAQDGVREWIYLASHSRTYRDREGGGVDRRS